MTKYELAILNIVSSSREHLRSEEVLSRLRERYPEVSRATCYNNLRKLSDAGLIRRLTLDGSGDRYDRTGRHDHLVCSSCGRVEDIFLPDLSEVISGHIGKEITDYGLKVMWICDECRKEAAMEAAEK